MQTTHPNLGGLQFPINRCHQRVVTCLSRPPWLLSPTLFPINRCHQRVVTRTAITDGTLTSVVEFPINRCHQRVVTCWPFGALRWTRRRFVSNQ